MDNFTIFATIIAGILIAMGIMAMIFAAYLFGWVLVFLYSAHKAIVASIREDR